MQQARPPSKQPREAVTPPPNLLTLTNLYSMPATPAGGVPSSVRFRVPGVKRADDIGEGGEEGVDGGVGKMMKAAAGKLVMWAPWASSSLRSEPEWDGEEEEGFGDTSQSGLDESQRGLGSGEKDDGVQVGEAVVREAEPAAAASVETPQAEKVLIARRRGTRQAVGEESRGKEMISQGLMLPKTPPRPPAGAIVGRRLSGGHFRLR